MTARVTRAIATIAAVGALALAGFGFLPGRALIVGFLPGEQVYTDANGCLGAALSAHGHSDCTSSYTDAGATHEVPARVRT